MWYNEPQYLADIEEHLGVTIQQVRLHPTSVADPGFIPNFFHPGSRVKKISGSGSASKNLSILTQNIVAKLSEIRCLSRIRIPDSDLDFYPSRIPDPGSGGQKGTGSRGQKGTGSRIRIRITAGQTHVD
jgi:hypothetical protein